MGEVLIKIKLKDNTIIFGIPLINQYVKDWMLELILNNPMLKCFIQDYTIEVKL